MGYSEGGEDWGRFEQLSDRQGELLNRADEILQLLDNTQSCSLAETLSSPLLRDNGETKHKAFRFPKLLVDEVEKFAQKTRLHQRQIFEAALVEFLRRHGETS